MKVETRIKKIFGYSYTWEGLLKKYGEEMVKDFILEFDEMNEDNWISLSWSLSPKLVSLDFYRTFSVFLDWDSIFNYRPVSDEVVEEFGYLSEYSRIGRYVYNYVSEDYLDRNFKKVDLGMLIRESNKKLSEKFIKKHWSEINHFWYELSRQTRYPKELREKLNYTDIENE